MSVHIRVCRQIRVFVVPPDTCHHLGCIPSGHIELCTDTAFDVFLLKSYLLFGGTSASLLLECLVTQVGK